MFFVLSLFLMNFCLVNINSEDSSIPDTDSEETIPSSSTNVFDSTKSLFSNSWNSVKETTSGFWQGTKNALGFDVPWIASDWKSSLFSFKGIIDLILAAGLSVVVFIFFLKDREIKFFGKFSKAILISICIFIGTIVFSILIAEEGSFLYNLNVGFWAGVLIALFDIGFFLITRGDEDNLTKFLYEKLILTLIVLPVLYAGILFVPILNTFLKTVTLYYFLPTFLKSVFLAVIVAVIPRILAARKAAKEKAEKMKGIDELALGTAGIRATGRQLKS
ncbi:hypothetical protein K9M16_05000 [Candidatus Babeliales bacterium]|nr:hypothetical protein [Candidatus Babeliales bacterium]